MPTARHRPARLGVIGFALPLLLVLAFAIILAFETIAATRARRRTAEQTLHDYAAFAAVLVANIARQEIERRLLYAFAPLRRYDAASGQPLPPPSIVALDRTEAARCAVPGTPAGPWIRVALADDAIAVDGAELPDSTLRWLADTLAADARSNYGEGWTFAHLFTDRPGLGLIAYSVLRDAGGEPVAIYAKNSCLDIDGEPLFRLANRGAPALPPSLTGGLPNDSLFSFRAMDPLGRVVQTSIRQTGAGISGRAGPLPQLGGLVLEVTLRPEIESRLVIGGIPDSRAPLALLLLLMILILSVLTLLQLRRHRELVRLRERFISNVSHELRTPLQQILVFSELLRMRRIDSEAEQQHSLEVIERETRRLIQMVENVLGFSREGRAEMPIHPQPVDLSAIVRETARSFEPLARTRRNLLLVEAEDDMSAVADADAVRRVLLNLLDNAVKYGPQGQTVTVSLHRHPTTELERGHDAHVHDPGVASTRRSAATRDFAVLSVADQGPGVPREARDRIFRPFQRLDREEQAAVAGSGIGLAIVRDLVTRMNGEVRVEDVAGGGARFVVLLPAGPVA
jgi:signal transduction histidine kinase